jgi:hypothetical protein
VAPVTDNGPARVAGPFPSGATLLEASSGRGWVLDDQGRSGSLGPALAWARRHRVRELHLLVDGPGAGSAAGGSPGAGGAAGVMARRAAAWADPPTVWRVAGRNVEPVVAAPVPAVIEPPADARALMTLLSGHGADVVIEHGVITAEVLGLEVARVVPVGDPSDPLGSSVPSVPSVPSVDWFPLNEEGWRIAVGVGHHDQEARAEMHPGEPIDVGLDRVVALVRELRRAGARRHPANTLSRERWIRALVVAQPGLVGATDLRPLPPPLPRHDLRLPSVAPALDPGGDHRPALVVCSIGVDLDLVPTAADLRITHGPVTDDPAGVRLVLVVPEGDDYPVTRDLAAALAEPAEVVVLPRDWMALGH